jgi:Flp pilus assembly protein TadG
MSRGLAGRARGRSGAVVPLFAVSIAAFLGFAALAVDMGMLYTAQTQAQRAADSAALAGAGWLVTSPGDTAGARLEAEVFAERHEVMGDSIDIDVDQDVEFESDTLVRVFVLRTDARSNPVTTYFARVLGIIDADVGVKAAAVVAPGAEVAQCLFPFVPHDPWMEAGGQRSIDIYFSDYDSAPVFDSTDYYQAPNQPGDVWSAYTGWGAKPGDASVGGDQGRYMRAKLGTQGNNTPSSGWWGHMNTPPDQQGGGLSNLTDAIAGSCPDYELQEDDDVYIQTGATYGPIKNALADELAPGNGPATVGEAKACYTTGTSCGNGKRIRTMVFYRPAPPPGPGSSNPLLAGNFGRVWLAGFCEAPPGVVQPDLSTEPECSTLSSQQDKQRTFVVMYLGPTSGVAAGDGGAASSGVKALRLVE